MCFSIGVDYEAVVVVVEQRFPTHNRWRRFAFSRASTPPHDSIDFKSSFLFELCRDSLVFNRCLIFIVVDTLLSSLLASICLADQHTNLLVLPQRRLFVCRSQHTSPIVDFQLLSMIAYNCMILSAYYCCCVVLMACGALRFYRAPIFFFFGVCFDLKMFSHAKRKETFFILFQHLYAIVCSIRIIIDSIKANKIDRIACKIVAHCFPLCSIQTNQTRNRSLAARSSNNNQSKSTNHH
jgi:hypothetical protein